MAEVLVLRQGSCTEIFFARHTLPSKATESFYKLKLSLNQSVRQQLYNISLRAWMGRLRSVNQDDAPDIVQCCRHGQSYNCEVLMVIYYSFRRESVFGAKLGQ